MHADAPSSSWYVPARHSVHLPGLSEPVAAAYLPAPHLIHASIADVEYCPAGHAVHVVPADDTGDEEEVPPSLVTIDPVAHTSHAVEACLPVYFPDTHGVQSPALLEPSTALDLPASQLSHKPCPALDWYLPDVQFSHADSFCDAVPDACLPAAHSLHAD